MVQFGTRLERVQACKIVQPQATPGGHAACACVCGIVMNNLFMAGPDLVQSELTALGAHGPYRLTISHGQGAIVEYFHTARAALLREAELEDLLMCARGASPAAKGVAI